MTKDNELVAPLMTGSDNKLDDSNSNHFVDVVNNSTFGFWKFDIAAKKIWCSTGFYKLLGYDINEIEFSYEFFIEHLLYFEDRDNFLNFNSSNIQIRLLTNHAGYRWFEFTAEQPLADIAQQRHGLLTDIHDTKITTLRLAEAERLHTETERIAKAGGWQFDINTNNLYLSKESCYILGLADQQFITLQDIVAFFETDHRQIFEDALDTALTQHQIFDLQLLYNPTPGKMLWVRCKGIPVIDASGKCIYIRGIFQEIEKIKKKELKLQNLLHVLDDRNKRLQTFAYTVSHDLRTHTGNLNSIIELYKSAETKYEQDEFFGHIQSISNSLGKTVKQLNEVVEIQEATAGEKRIVNFEAIFKNTIAVLQRTITEAGAQIDYNFTECKTIPYIPAYLESIFQNLLTNALKYSYPGRKPLISCYTFSENNNIYLVFKDNGLGIDLDRYGKDVFGLYKTFHQNGDAKGVGLFITRTQIEALGGTITIESEVNVGTTFIITLVKTDGPDLLEKQ